MPKNMSFHDSPSILKRLVLKGMFFIEQIQWQMYNHKQ